MNRLAGQTSPYLLQHAGNPVDWYPWGEEALRRAADGDRPIFLSIGYSACHWCHVMERESFESEEIASLLNESFVSIKVDREERPDIDDVYQKACMAVTGQGGWPLSAFLTPEQKPFYIGTYFPPLDSYGRPGFGSIVRQMAQAWRENNGDVRARALKLAYALAAGERDAAAPQQAAAGALDAAAHRLLSIGDAANGGFGSAPKFPNTAALAFMLRMHAAGRSREAGAFALRTLSRMAAGGMFDHVGGGFHRYSTDARWLVPHFEKMLYDNALLPLAYAEAFRASGDASYARVAARTLDFVLRELGSAGGALCSALDADSEGEEGRFYVWTAGEVRDVLGDEAPLYCARYGITDGGNWEGVCIPHESAPLRAVAFKLGTDERAARGRLDAANARLLEARSRRQRPGLDDKVITAWNAMAIKALAAVGAATREARYTDAALRCAGFVRDNLTAGSRSELLRSWRAGSAGGARGYLEDYAWYADALLDLFSHGGDPLHLEHASELARTILSRFWDAGAARFYMTGRDSHEELMVRPASVHDMSVPSGASVAARVMRRLGAITGEACYADAARAYVAARAGEAAENPFAFGSLLCTAFALEAGTREVVLLDGGGGEAMRAVLDSAFLPESTCVYVSDAQRLDALSHLALFSGKQMPDGGAVAYVCRGSTCSAPLRTAGELAGALS